MTETNWYVYLAKCADDTLYTGITNNLERRMKQHNGKLQGGARYTSGRRPVVLVWYEKVFSRSQAHKREIEIRSLSKDQKTRLTFES